MKLGYARVSTSSQDLTRQIEWLEIMKCEKIFSEKISGTKSVINRPKMKELISVIRSGDVLYVDEISRLGRNTQETITTINILLNQNIDIVLNKEGMTLTKTNPIGIAIAALLAVIAEIELIYKRERSVRAIKIAKERGVKIGRKPGYSEAAKSKIKAAKKLYELKGSEMSIEEMITILKISRPTFYNYLKAAGVTLYRDKKDE